MLRHACRWALMALAGAVLGCSQQDPSGPGYIYGQPERQGSSGAGTSGAPNPIGGRSPAAGGAGMAGGGTSPDEAGTDAPAGAGSGAAGGGATGGSDPEPGVAFEGEGTAWEQPVPRASCGSGDMAEGELQGEGVENVRCNLEIAGRVEVDHFLSLAWYGDCAFAARTI